MSTITIELDNLTAEEQETVKRLANKKKRPYFEPEYMEKYFNIVTIDNIACYVNTVDCYDIFNFSIGNCFKTEEEAKEAITRMQMQTKWKRLSLEAGEAENPWDEGSSHHFVYWDCIDKKIGNSYHTIWIDGLIYFPTEKSIKAAIAELGEANVKKYILGVEE